MQAARDRAGAATEGPLLDPQDIRTLERLSLESLDAIVTGLVGEREAPGRSTGFEFADYRRYTPGDDVRRIDWNVYARLRELYVRTAPQEASLWLSVLLDASRSMDTGKPNKLRYGRRLAALLGAVALLHSDAVEMHTLSDGDSAASGSFDSGGDALGAMVSELERLPAGRTTQLRESLRRAAKSGWQPEMAVLISDGLVADDELAAAIAELASSARRATLVHVVDPADGAGELEGSTLLLDSETGRQIDALITPEVRERYAARYEGWRAGVERQCRARGVRYVRADVTIDPLELLIAGARDGRLLDPEESIRPATPRRNATSAASARIHQSGRSPLASAPS
jgi:uncharacterized protein (DUF58 family)